MTWAEWTLRDPVVADRLDQLGPQREKQLLALRLVTAVVPPVGPLTKAALCPAVSSRPGRVTRYPQGHPRIGVRDRCPKT